MKAKALLLLTFLLSGFAAHLSAQNSNTPQGFTYQAVARDGGAVYSNQTFNVRFSIRQGAGIVFQEEHFSVTTNQYGLFSAVVGTGIPVAGSFVNIDWGGGNFFLQVELNDGTGYTLLGDNRLWAVPYSLYAEKAYEVENVNFVLSDLLDVDATAPQVGDALVWDGTNWVPGPGGGGSYFAGAGIQISNDSIINTGDPNEFDDITINTGAGGDLTGNYPNPTVRGLNSRPMSLSAPGNNDVLKWNAGTQQWEPKPDAVSTGGAFNVTARLSGDGSIGSPLDISQQGANDGQVLKWNGTTWTPANDSGQVYGLQLVGNTLTLVPGGSTGSVSLGTQYNAGPGINLVGGTIVNTGDIDASDDITTSTTAGGDLSGLYPNPTVNGLAGFPLSSQSPGLNQILKFNGTTWVPDTDDDTDADADPNNEIQTISINGNLISLSQGGGSVGIPVYLQGAGINISSNIISNTGDLDPNNDITNTTAAGGDLSGVYPSPVVRAINGFSVANTTPLIGQVYKYNGGQWIPDMDAVDDADADPNNEIQSLSVTGGNISISGGNSVPLPIYFEGTGIDITNSVITNIGDTDASDDITTATIALGDVNGTFPTLTVDGLQGTPISSQLPTSGQIFKFNGTQWSPDTDLVYDGDSSQTNELQILTVSRDTIYLTNGGFIKMPYNAGAGININPNTLQVTNIGDLDATNELQTLTQSGNTLTLSGGGGSATIQPYLGGTGIDVTSNIITNTGDTDPNDDITNTTSAGGDLSGTYPNVSVTGLNNLPLPPGIPGNNQTLKWTGSQWVYGDDEGEIYFPGSGIAISGGNVITNTGDLDASDDVLLGSSPSSGDVSGTYDLGFTVEGLQGNPISNSAPTSNQILKWNGTQWAPSNDDNTTYNAGTGLNLIGNTFLNTGDIDASDDITTASNAAGDVSGTFPTLTVEALQGNDVSNAAPTLNQILKWNGTTWVPSSDVNTTYNAGTGITISGTTITNTGDTDASDDITTASNAAGDVSGTFPTLTVEALQGNDVSNAAPSNNEILKWNSTTSVWEPAGDENTTYAAGTGLSLSGTTFTNTGDTDASDDITTASNATGDVSGTFPTLTVDGLQGNPVSNTTPISNEVLKWNGAQWIPGTDDDTNTTYTAGSGLNLTGTTFTNTGDIDASDDITTSSNAGGDASGTFGNLNVNGLQGNPVANTAPGSGEILKWNGTQWVPGTDDDTNTTYTAGSGLNLSGTTFTNTGDTDASDDITTSSNAAGDVAGTFPTLTVDGLQGNPVASTAPASGQVLKWDGSQWAPAIDDNTNTTYNAGTGISISGTTIANTGDTDASDDITTATSGAGDVSGTFPTLTVDGLQGNPVANTAPASGEVLKWNGSQWAPDSDIDNNTTYTAGTGLNLSGTTFINTGDTDASDDLTTSSTAGGDASGAFSALNVSGLQGNPVSGTVPASGEVLKWNGTTWAPATDDGTIYIGGAGITVSGSNIINTGDTDASDDITTATSGAGDVSGTFPTLTVDGLQGNPVANTAPASGEVLKWNGTQWAPDSDIDNNTTYNAGTGLNLSGTTFINTGDTDASDDLTTASTAGGDASGAFSALNVSGLQGNPVSGTVPASGEVLKWNGTTWAPATDDGTTYVGGTGITVSGSNIINTGDTDASDDITTATSGAGDVSGTFPTLTVDGLQGNPVANTAPASGEVLKWNGTQWAPASDIDNNTTYTAGTGLNLSGTTFINTGDTDASDDLTTASTAGGDASGAFSALNVSGLQGNPVSGTVPASGEVLKWNGTTWAPGTDDGTTYVGGTGITVSGANIINTGDTDASDDITTASNAAGDVSGTFPTLTVDGLQGNPVANTAPTSGEVLKWNGTQWAPASDIDNNTTYTAGTGMTLSGTTFINTGDTDASDDLTTASTAGGDATGTFAALSVNGLQGNPVAGTVPASGEVLKWNGTAWAPAIDQDAGTIYTGGTGITVSGTTILNTGDTDASDDITTASNAAGDVSGTFPTLTVDGLQGNPVANTAPTSGEVLKWNGTQWAPASDIDINTTYTAGTGMTLSGTTFINTGDTDASDDLTTASSAIGDVTGTFSTMTVEGLQGRTVANTAPSSGEVLKWTGTEWAPATDTDNNTTYTAGTGLSLSGTTFANTGDTDGSDDITTATSGAGDVSGTFPTLTVDGLQGNAVAATAPASGEVLKWDGTEWAPATDDGTTYAGGTGITVSGTTIINTGDTDASDDITTASSGAGDVTGTFPTLTVDGLQGNAVSSTAPASGEVLKWDGTEWAPATDDGVVYTGGTGITVSGTTITNSGDTDASDDITTASSGAGDVSGTFPSLTVDGLQGNPIANTAPASGEVLKWNGTQWAPATDTDNNTTYTAGTGLSLSGTTFLNTGDTDASDDITTATAGAGDVSGTFPSLTVDGLQGNPVASTTPTSGEVLSWNGTEWEPSTDANTTYAAGTGLSLSGTTFTNTGDTDASDDVTTASNAGGDVSGNFANLTVDGIQGNPVSNAAPSSGEILKWNGTQWLPSTDAIDDADADASNEIQTLSISGNTVSLSSGGGSVNINPYSGGTGISISGTTITNTGDTDASDDITTATSAAGDLSGSFPTLTVSSLQGNALSSSAPAGEDVLRWNGSAWTPHADTDSSETNEIQGLAIAGNLLTISAGNTVLLPTTAPTYLPGAGINIDGTNTIINIGDIDASDDITTATAGAGDVSGTFPTLTVEALQGNAVSTSAPTSEDVLRWNGTNWTPHADTDSSETNELQNLAISGITMSISGGNSVNLPYVGGSGVALSGATIINTGDTDASDDVTTSSNAAGDVTGIYSNLTVEGLQGNPIANTTPISGEILKWNGTQWAPSVDDNDNTTYTAGTGIAVSGGNVISNTGDTDASDDITTASTAAGDVSGTFPTLTVDGLQGNPVANTAPSTGEALEWNGTQWAPATDDNTTYTAGTGIFLSGTVFSNTGDTDASDDITTATNAAGDVSGTFPTLTVDGLQGNPVANTAPNTDEVLKWNGTAWEAAADDTTTYVAGAGLALTGNSFSNTGDTDASDDITTATSGAGDVSGTFPTLTVDGLQGNPVAVTAPNTDEVLKWNGAAWEAAADDTASYVAGAGLALTGNSFSNTGDTDASDDITTASTAAGDVSGTFPTLTVDGLQGNPVAVTAPNTDEVLKWNGTAWEAAADDTTTYVAGAGLALTGNSFSNTGDTDASDDITTASTAAGDVSGTFPTLTVDGLQGNPVAVTAPNTDEVLKWNGTAWEAAADDTTTYVAGAGLALTGNSFSNTGDTDGSDDITTASTAAGDVSGTFPTLTVDGLQGTAVSATAPVQTEFLKYNGTDWAADTINSDEVLYDASVIPTTDATIDLGSSSNRWRDAYVANGITVTSDMRAKTNVENLDYGMDEIMALRPVRYNWIGDATMEQKLGLIAQEMLPIIGEVVQTQEARVNPETGETEIMEMSLFGVNYMELLPVLIKGMQEQQETLQTQQQLLELQSKQIEQLEKRLEQLENK